MLSPSPYATGKKIAYLEVIHQFWGFFYGRDLKGPKAHRINAGIFCSQVAVLALAEFHGLCIAHDLLEDRRLVDLFPVFEPRHLMWFQVQGLDEAIPQRPPFQDDMVQFLETMSKTATEFLDSIPGEQETARSGLPGFL